MSSTHDPDNCPACGVAWVRHPGLEQTCLAHREAVLALRIVHTWATYGAGIFLDPDHVAELVARTLAACDAPRCQARRTRVPDPGPHEFRYMFPSQGEAPEPETPPRSVIP